MAGKTILIVDYDTQSLESLRKLLTSQKYHVITAGDGQAGYDMFAKEKPDLVVLEAILPKIHGFDLTKKITQESKGQVPVIIVTGLYRGPQYRHEAMVSFGATDYFEKPLDNDRFLSVLKEKLHDEDDIEEDLPDSNSIIEILKKRILGRSKSAPSEVSGGQGKRE